MHVAPLAGGVEGDADAGAVGRALEGARLELGEAPPLLLALARAPAALEGVWALLEGTLLRGKLPRTTKELIALAALAAAGVAPLRELLGRALAARGVDPRVLADLAERSETPRLPERTQRIVAFGLRAALQPALLAEADFGRLRREGLDEAAQAELVAFAGALALLIACSRALGCAA